jgi:hypothetical protein
MVRDMDLVRMILLKTEALVPGEGYQLAKIAGHDEYTFAAHVELLKEAGFVEGVVGRASGIGPVTARVRRLTWPGHEFLDSIRSDTVWAETKAAITSTVGTAGLEVIKAVASAVSLRMLGL